MRLETPNPGLVRMWCYAAVFVPNLTHWHSTAIPVCYFYKSHVQPPAELVHPDIASAIQTTHWKWDFQL